MDNQIIVHLVIIIFYYKITNVLKNVKLVISKFNNNAKNVNKIINWFIKIKINQLISIVSYVT